MFFVRLTEMPPDSFAVFYLQVFAIPLYKLIAWTIVCGELYAAIGLLLGLTTRTAAAVVFLSCLTWQSAATTMLHCCPFLYSILSFSAGHPANGWALIGCSAASIHTAAGSAKSTTTNSTQAKFSALVK
jgi:uncharacterized membrane protein YphA (DoxX/SURF4 family)